MHYICGQAAESLTLCILDNALKHPVLLCSGLLLSHRAGHFVLLVPVELGHCRGRFAVCRGEIQFRYCPLTAPYGFSKQTSQLISLRCRPASVPQGTASLGISP